MSDEQLLQAFIATGDYDHFHTLCARTEADLSKHVARFIEGAEIVAEVVAEAFVYLFQHFDRFQGGDGCYDHRLRPWLFAVARNIAIDRRQELAA